MEFESVIRGRRSIRAYTSEAVPEELIREILERCAGRRRGATRRCGTSGC